MSAERNQKAKVGRPVVVGQDAIVRNVRLSREQDQAVLKAAKKAQKRPSEWMRDTLALVAQAA
jgi:hypothetical protein